MSPESHRALFTKRRGGRGIGSIQWEVAGLSWLREATAAGGARVADVVDHGDDHLVERRLTVARPTGAMAEEFGRALAATHRLGAPGFGAGPPGWRGDGFLGDAVLPMPDEALASWGEFHAVWRIAPFAAQARDRGALGPDAARLVSRVCDRLVAGDFDHGEVPSRIHGDLWSGNAMWTTDGVVLIDPAAHGGDAEADIAMLHLFGCPMLEQVSRSWARAFGADDNWPERIGLHQLHPLLVHAVLFGGGYGDQAAEVARRYA